MNPNNGPLSYHMARLEAEADRASFLVELKRIAAEMGATLVYDMRPLGRPDSLDAAWAEAEAALPEEWQLSLVDSASMSGVSRQYDARAIGIGIAGSKNSGWYDAPAAALRALTAKLAGPPSKETA